MGKVATSPLPSRGSPPLHSRGGNQKWPTSGQSGYVTPAVSGIPTTSEQGGISEVAHLWAKWLRHPCRLGDPHHCRAGGGGIKSGPLVGKVATSPLPSRGSPPLQSRGGNQKWPTSGQRSYVTPAVSGIPTTAERGGGGGSEVAHLGAKWRRQPCRPGDAHRFRAGGEIRSGPQVGKVATSPLPSRGSPPLQSRGGGGSKVAHLWAKWLRHPCPLGDPHHFRAGGEIRSGPQVGKVATSPLPSRGSPPLRSGGGGGGSKVAHKWAKWLRHPCRLGDPHHCRAGGEIRSGPQVGKVATSPLPSRGSPPLHSGGGRGGESQVAHLWAKWRRHPCRLGDAHRFRAGGEIRSGYVTPAVSGIPSIAKPGAKVEVAHKWAKWRRHPCRLGDPHHFRAGGEIRGGPQVGKVATSPLPSRGSPPLQSGGGSQKWHTNGQSGYVTPAVSGIPSIAERGAKSEVAHKWAKWLRHPCRLGDPHRFRAGGEIGSGPLVGKVATSPLPSRGSPPLHSGGGNQKWPTCGQSGYVTPTVSGAPPLHSGGAKSEVAHRWAKWRRHPCHLGDSNRFRAGGEIRSGPLVGKVATSPLPSWESPPLQSGGGKSEVAPLWAKWQERVLCIVHAHASFVHNWVLYLAPLPQQPYSPKI